jgi:hypothetical protein
MVELEEKKEKKTEKKLDVAKDASIDFTVEVIATESDPYHETGAKFHAGTKKAAELVKRGWVKMAMIALLIISCFGAIAQTSVDQPLYNATNTYTLANLNAATMVRDTVTSTATGFLTSKRISGDGIVTIQALVTKVSGTVGGTITIMGSLDGTNFEALATRETRTALATQTAADATASYSWRLVGSDFLYYRVSYVGASGAVAYLNARIMKH